MVKQERKKHKHMGGNKLHKKLKPEMIEMDIKCGRDKFFDILRDENLLVHYRKRFVTTTQSHHRYKKYPNLIENIIVTRAEQVWASDITYIRTKKGFMYLFLITDVYSKQIIGYELSDNLKTTSAIKALRKAIKNRNYPERELIHHSDKGLQYCNPAYTDILENNHIKVSMTQKYDPYENAVAERVNGILKREYEIGEGFLNHKDARREINYAIWLYNTDRPHLSCHGMVPVLAHKKENYKLKKWPTKFSSKDMSLEEKNSIFNTNLLT
jgi:putative transposase